MLRDAAFNDLKLYSDGLYKLASKCSIRSKTLHFVHSEAHLSLTTFFILVAFVVLQVIAGRMTQFLQVHTIVRCVFEKKETVSRNLGKACVEVGNLDAGDLN
jgi:hypothetical protein